MGIESPRSVGRAVGGGGRRSLVANGRLRIEAGRETRAVLRVEGSRDSISKRGRRGLEGRGGGWPRAGLPGSGRRRRRAEELGPEGFDRRPKLVEGAVVGQDVVGLSALLLERPLDLLAGGEALRPTTLAKPRAGPAGSRARRRRRRPSRRAYPSPPHRGSRRRGRWRHPPPAGLAGDGLLERLPHRGVEDRFEVAERARVGEDDRPEGPAVDRPGGRLDSPNGSRIVLAEPLEDPVAAGALFEQDVADRVGVEEERPKLGEDRGGQALARADPADQADDRDRAVPPGAGGSATRSGIVDGWSGA